MAKVLREINWETLISQILNKISCLISRKATKSVSVRLSET